MIELQQVSHRYHHWVLKDVSIKLHEGQCCILTGSNGSGKTTFLKICAGLLQPTYGRRIVKENVNLQCALMSSFLYSELTALQNLEFYASLQGRHQDSIDWAIQTWGLGSFIDQQVGTLSLGQQQRCSLARATLTEPNFLCLDEPSSALDAESLGLLEAYLQSFAGLAIISTHDPACFESFANCHLRLHDNHRLERR